MLFPPCSVYQTSDTKEREYQPSNSCGKLQLSTRSYYLRKAASITTEIKPDIVATAGGSKYWLVRDRENNGSANHASVEDENLITPAKGRVEEGISGSQKLSLSLQVQQQNKTFKQTNYVLNIPCASRKIRDSFHSQTYYKWCHNIIRQFHHHNWSYCRDSSGLQPITRQQQTQSNLLPYLSRDVLEDAWPVHSLRHLATQDTFSQNHCLHSHP